MSSSKPNIDINQFKLTPEQIATNNSGGCSNSISIKELEKEFNRLDHINILNDKHNCALSDLFPSYLLESCHSTDWQLFLKMSRFDRWNDTFVVGCFDNIGFKLISYKWRYKNGIKWKAKTGSHPNSTLLTRIYSEDGTIYCIEGQKDSLSAVLLGLDFIMIPYAGFKLRDPIYLQNEVAQRHVVFIVEDKPAWACMKKIAPVIAETAKSIQLLFFGEGGDKKMDLSDFIKKYNSIEEVHNGLQNRR